MGTYELVGKFNISQEEYDARYSIYPPLKGHKLVIIHRLSNNAGLYAAVFVGEEYYLGTILYPSQGYSFPETEEEIWEALDYTEYIPSYTSPCSYEDVLL